MIGTAVIPEVMKRSRFLIAALLLQFSQLHAAERADMGEVGDYMSRMLQNMHFERPPFMEMSQRFLDDFIADLDPERVFFVQGDIDGFNRDYGQKLSRMLLVNEGPKAAADIYGVYRKRVVARVAESKRILADGKFEFTKDESISRNRKTAAWPKDEADAMKIWGLQIKESVLSEKLRRDVVAKRAKDQGKPDPTVKEKPVNEMIALRHERLLHRVMQDVTDTDISSMFLSAVAQSFDPHTDYMQAPEMGRFKEILRNELVGIGAQLRSAEEGSTKITGIMVDGPADKQGKLKLDDAIVAVDTDGADGPKPMVDVMFMDSNKVVDLIRGESGTKVLLKVNTAGSAEPSLIEIVREKVELKAALASAQIIQTKAADGEIARLGIITLPSFYVDFDGRKAGCSEDVENLLVRLNQEKIDGLILDLRLNGGGSLPEVQRMTGLFSGSGPVTQVKDTIGRITVLESQVHQPVYTGPMIVLTDKSSASASEILAGALQDTNRAVIVGQSSTFGKGTVQKTIDISPHMPMFAASEGAGTLKLTIQKFYRPSGSSTQNKGVIPDIILPDATDAYEFGEAFLDHSLKHDFIRAAAGLKPQDRNLLALPRLKELSDERVNESRDFAYLKSDIEKAKGMIKDNRISLLETDRAKQLAESEDQQRTRNAERNVRYPALQKQDKDTMTFYNLTVEDAISGKPLVVVDPSQEDKKYMKTAKSDLADLDNAPLLPSSLDLQKRESIMILLDMVDIGRSARMAGIFKKEDVR